MIGRLGGGVDQSCPEAESVQGCMLNNRHFVGQSFLLAWKRYQERGMGGLGGCATSKQSDGIADLDPGQIQAEAKGVDGSLPIATVQDGRQFQPA